MEEMVSVYLKQRQVEFKERGTFYMVPIVQQMLDEGVNSVEDLKQKLVECSRQKESFEKFSVKYQYYWGIETYLQDMVTHAPTNKEEEKK